MDLYTTNNDYTGKRTLDKNKELVEFHQNSLHRIWYNEQTDSFEPHWHQAMEIIIPTENYYDIIANNTNYHIVPGDIIIVPPGIVHEIIAPEYGVRYVYLIDISLLTKLNGFSAVSPALAEVLTLNAKSHANIYDDVYQNLMQIRNVYFNEDEYSEMKIHALITNLLIMLAENYMRSNAAFPNARIYKQKEYVSKLNLILEYIDSHYVENLDLDTVAKVSGFSKFHFTRLFKQYMDMTFYDYLNFRRMRAAEELLASPDYSITELALASGFPSISTFNRVFKAKHGCTPTEYRMKNNQYRSQIQTPKS